MYIKIRGMMLDDIPALIKIVRDENAVEDYPGEYSRATFRNMMGDEETMIRVAVEDGKPVGFAEFQGFPRKRG